MGIDIMVFSESPESLHRPGTAMIYRSRPVSVSEDFRCTLPFFSGPTLTTPPGPERSRTLSGPVSRASPRPVERDQKPHTLNCPSGGWLGGKRYPCQKLPGTLAFACPAGAGPCGHCNLACDSRACKEPCQDSHIIRLPLCLFFKACALPQPSEGPGWAGQASRVFVTRA